MPRTEIQRKKTNEARRKKNSEKRKQKIIKEHGDECAFVVHSTVQTIMKRVLQKAKARARMNKWVSDNRERKRANDKSAYETNKKNASGQGKTYDDYMKAKKRKSSEKPRRSAAERIRERKQTDETFLIRTRLGGRLSEFLRLVNSTKARGTMELIGCDRESVVLHLESQLHAKETLRSMQTDHIFAMGLYTPMTEMMQKRVMHWSNLQPLTTHENVNKGKKLPTKAMAAKVERWAWPDGITEDMLPDIYDGWATPLRMNAA